MTHALWREGMKLEVREDVFPIAGTFTISRGSRTESRVVTVELTRDGTHRGRARMLPLRPL